jgi:hypothetical protein
MGCLILPGKVEGKDFVRRCSTGFCGCQQRWSEDIPGRDNRCKVSEVERTCRNSEWLRW